MTNAYLAGIDVADNDDVDMSLLLTIEASSVMIVGDVWQIKFVPHGSGVGC